MHGRAHSQVKTNLKVLPLGDGKFTWYNTSNSYVSSQRWNTYEEAEAALNAALNEGTEQ